MMPCDGVSWRKIITLLCIRINFGYEYLMNQPITVLQEIIDDVAEIDEKSKE